jgi:hypothetical protein
VRRSSRRRKISWSGVAQVSQILKLEANIPSAVQASAFSGMRAERRAIRPIPRMVVNIRYGYREDN